MTREKRLYAPGAVWDERRNTSRVFPVPPGEGLRAANVLRNWGDANWAHRDWICDGAPTLTEAGHVARFGQSYEASRRKVRS